LPPCSPFLEIPYPPWVFPIVGSCYPIPWFFVIILSPAGFPPMIGSRKGFFIISPPHPPLAPLSFFTTTVFVLRFAFLGSPPRLFNSCLFPPTVAQYFFFCVHSSFSLVLVCLFLLGLFFFRQAFFSSFAEMPLGPPRFSRFSVFLIVSAFDDQTPFNPQVPRSSIFVSSFTFFSPPCRWGAQTPWPLARRLAFQCHSSPKMFL